MSGWSEKSMKEVLTSSDSMGRERMPSIYYPIFINHAIKTCTLKKFLKLLRTYLRKFYSSVVLNSYLQGNDFI